MTKRSSRSFVPAHSHVQRFSSSRISPTQALISFRLRKRFKAPVNFSKGLVALSGRIGPAVFRHKLHTIANREGDAFLDRAQILHLYQPSLK